MKDLQDPTITLMVYEPVNEQAHDEPTAVPYVCEVQFYWPECGCVATIGGLINKTADLQGWNARTFVEVSAYTAETYADTPDWYEEWEMPIHIPDDSGIDVLQIVRSVNVHLRGLTFDEVVYPLEAIE